MNAPHCARLGASTGGTCGLWASKTPRLRTPGAPGAQATHRRAAAPARTLICDFCGMLRCRCEVRS